ncbi:hypothetical protein ACFQ1E_11930 [Sphingomonas canadensis]|uniref:DUF4175 domain-containing protein n=1 Tax=Sphingomonas canadensis TaxID=1219257 RepID=A0ABW3HCJ8_9SPHN|nr:hypothetical protein [Sphingomonas canadensis]MCW3836817.1 hypothetical protein [Sphingomonas canadensis]
MPASVKAGVPVIGVIFLALALLKFFQGDGWVVWAILGFLFGGFGIFTMNRSKGDRA